MADKDSKEELERKRKAEAEIFGKTMGFTHTPSPEELERTVILTPASHQEPDLDFESTVRFSNFDALVESTVSNDNGPGTQPEKPAAPKVEAKPQPPKAPVTPPPVPPVQAKAPQPAPQKPAAPKVEAKPQPPKTPVTPPPVPPVQAKAPQPAPQKPAAPKVEAKPQPPKAPVTPPPVPPVQAKAPQPAPEKPAAPEPAAETPKSVEIAPKSELDFAESEFTLTGSLMGGPENIEEKPPAPEPIFDSSAALDELDELLKMDLPDDLTPEHADESGKESGPHADSLGHAAIFGDDDEFNTTMDSIPMVQLGAEDLAEDDALLLEDEGDDLLTGADRDADDLSEEFAMDDLDRDLPVADESPVEEGLIDLSGFDASLEDNIDDFDKGAVPEEDDNEFLDAEGTDADMSDWNVDSLDKGGEETTGPEEENEFLAANETDMSGWDVDSLDKDGEALTGPGLKAAESDDEYSFTDQDKETRPEAVAEDLPAAEPVAVPAASPVAADERIEQPAPRPPEKRRGSGFAITLSLLAIIAAGASFWFSQGGSAGGFSPMSAQLELQLAQTTDRLSRIESSNRQLAMQVQTLIEKNDALEKQLADLDRVAAKPAQAGRKKAAVNSRRAIQPSTPLESTNNAPAKPKAEGYVINLTSVSSAESANQEIARLQQMGVNAEAIRTEARGKIWYRIRVSGFSTLQDAEAESAILGEKLGIKDIWVGKP